ncbi:hypothetical protein OROMI_027081 [Orobanche minor]
MYLLLIALIFSSINTMYNTFFYQLHQINIFFKHIMALKIEKRTQMSEKIRVEMCKMKELHPGWKQKDFAKWLEDTHNLKLSQSAILKAFKRSINNDDQQALSNPNAKRLRPLEYPLMESALYEWFVCNQEHVNISGELLKEKGRIFLKSLYPETVSFEFSNGWSEKFKHRNAIQSFQHFGESGSVDMEKIEASLPSIREELDKWDLKDIYNMDETCLFYRMQDDNSLATKELEGRKQNKERITIVICTNGDGSDKVPFWIIGKFHNPRCLKNVNCSTLNCTYRANSNAWMTSLFFVEWLKWFDSRLDRNVLLLLDNCTAHGKKEHLPPLHLTNVMFLPPNSTSKIQPCDAGIIRNFKGYYRQRFNRLLLKRIEDRVLEPSKISLLDGMINAVAAWSIDVKPRMIENCFKQCKIRTVEVDELQVAKEMNEENQKLLKELKSQVKDLHYTNEMEMDIFLNHPNEQQIVYALTDEEIIEGIRQENEENNPEGDSIEVQKVSCEEALSLLDKLEIFWVQQEGGHVDELMRTRKLKDKITTQKIKSLLQSTLNKYFKST